MPRYSTAEEVRERHVAALGPELGRVYHELQNECAWLHLKWGEYHSLFGTSQERVDVMNAAAAQFFGPLHDILWQDLLLHLARLVDRASTSGRQNLSIRRLPPLVAEEIRPELEDAVATAVESASFATDWRNRRIAHRDLEVAMDEGASLATASHQLLLTALGHLAAALNKIELHYLDSTVGYDVGMGIVTGAEALLYVMRDGVEAERSMRERLQRGDLRPEDLKPPRPL